MKTREQRRTKAERVNRRRREWRKRDPKLRAAIIHAATSAYIDTLVYGTGSVMLAPRDGSSVLWPKHVTTAIMQPLMMPPRKWFSLTQETTR